ncbi:MAG TPA: hypothetical protein DDW52_06800 [Planctomycetaceae bacterium]|nr:hypothetical protein [Planctomycetaceae bacterium]
MKQTRRRNAFTIVELLVVIAITSILIALLLPAAQSAREAARRTQCAKNIREIGLALHGFENVNRRLPPAHWQHPSNIAPNFYGQPRPKEKSYYFSWLTRILPYAGQMGTYDKIDFTTSPFINPKYELPSGGYLNSVQLPVFRCPSNPRNEMAEHTFEDGRTNRFAFTNYLGVNGTDQFQFDGMIYVNSQVRLSQVSAQDGTSNTLMVGERPPVYDSWYGWWFSDAGLYPWFGAAGNVLGTSERIADKQGNCFPDAPQSKYQDGSLQLVNDGFDWDKHAWHFWSFHPGGSHFVFADGHVSFLSYSINEKLFHDLSTRNGSEVIREQF